MQRPLKKFYFSKYEDRKPYQPIPDNGKRSLIFQFFGIITIMMGLSYLHWRWFHSLNHDALWFAIPLAAAETLSFIGTILVVFNWWSNKDPEKKAPVHYLSEIENLRGRKDRPVKIDVHIATYNEEVELVRYSIRDAKNMVYPYKDVQIKVFVLDDGRRDGRDPNKENMKLVAEEEGVGYLCRENNEGYKAGNLKNGLEHTNGDLFVILDADTRPFSSFLENTTGYFRNKKLAWVQTPQWFYDTTPGTGINEVIKSKLRIKNNKLSEIIDKSFGWLKTGRDIFGNDPRLFYDVILRRRNFYNAAFCCGAGSIHRREAVMNKAIKDFVTELELEGEETKKTKGLSFQDFKKIALFSFMKKEVKPFKFHASEDIYTSMAMHGDSEKWESLQHPFVECKMLSPQDLDACVKQRTRYSSGSLDIAFQDNPFFERGLTIGQKICYFNTIWSYFSPLWITVFLLAPIIYFFAHIMPVQAYSFDFFKYFLIFQMLNSITITLGCWGIHTVRGEQYYISGFWLTLRSLISTVRGKKVKFNVTPKSKQIIESNKQHIWPHITLIVLMSAGILYNFILLFLHQLPSLSGFIANSMWSIANIINLSVIIRAAHWEDKEESGEIMEEEKNNIIQKSIITMDAKNMIPVYTGKAV